MLSPVKASEPWGDDGSEEDPTGPELAEPPPAETGVLLLGVLETTTVIDGLTASGFTPLVAVTVNVDDPAAVGVPESTPVAALRVKPAGRDPEDTMYLVAGSPVALNV